MVPFRFHKQWSLILAVLMFFAPAIPGAAQPAPRSADSYESPVGAPEGPGQSSSPTAPAMQAQGSTSELVSFLSEHPEISSQLKPILASELARQGSAVDAQAITDELLASHLESDSG